MKTYERNPNVINIRFYGINEDKVKLSLHLIHCCAMKICGEVVVYLHAFLTMVLFGGERITAHLESAFFLSVLC
jgi:hypothetical protein